MQSRTIGHLSAFGAFLIWAIAPIFWSILPSVSSWELMVHRLFWGIIMVLPFTCRHMAETWHVLKSAGRSVISSSVLIIFNWTLFVWAVTNGHVIEASLGYFINPLINVLLGVFFFGEVLKASQRVALSLAFIGTSFLFMNEWASPLISLGVAFSFATYGFLRKKDQVRPIMALQLEMVLGFVFMVSVLLINTKFQDWAFHREDLAWWKFALAGPVTVIPLFLFTQGIQRLPMSLMGMWQYMAPLGQFLLGVLFFKESFGILKGIGIVFIFIGVIIFLIPNFRPLPLREELHGKG